MAIWQSGSGEAQKAPRSRRRKARRRQEMDQVFRRAQIEQCEPRNLMAVTPQLIAIIPNAGDLLDLSGANQRSDAFRELTLRFDEGQRIDESSAQDGGIQVVRAGGDGVFGNANDVNVTPTMTLKNGFVGLGDRPNEIVVRFSGNLPDDLYQIRVTGALVNVEQIPAAGRTVNFELDLGPQIVAVVPQPISRVGGVLQQARNEIEVYFNDDDLNVASAQNAAFYQLIRTRKTADNLDDGATFNPISVVYDPVSNKARLIFAQDLAGLDTTESTYRLRIGNRYTAPTVPIELSQLQTNEAADTFNGAVNINTQVGKPSLDSQTIIVGGEIKQVTPYGLELPGSNDEPGHRDIPARDFPLTEVRRGVDSPHVEETDTDKAYSTGTVAIVGGRVTLTGGTWPSWAADADLTVNGVRYTVKTRDSGTQLTLDNASVSAPAGAIYRLHGQGVETIYYSFKTIYGTDPQNSPLTNLMSPTQKARAREAFEYYSRYLGVQFIEISEAVSTAPPGAEWFVVALGDLRAVDPIILPGPGNALVLASRERNLAVVDNAEDWGDSEPGGGFFRAAMQGIGQLLGMGHAFDLPATTIMGDTTLTNPDAAFPGDHDIVHGRHTHRPESTDIDVFKFTLNQAGIFSAEIAAERLIHSSLLDSTLWVYNSSRQLIARNDDYYSEDAFVEVELQPGDYYVVVTSAGMSEIDPSIANSGFGGTTEGNYELRLNFEASPERNPTALSGIVDIDVRPTLLDGDTDGHPGGEYNFWFTVASAANTFIVDKAAPTGGNGSLASPFNNIQAAFAAATTRNSNGNPADDVKVVRIVGNGGTDNNTSTLGNNFAYEIGVNSLGGILADGAEMHVPKGVTVMIDAGAIFKLRRANIDAGSKSQGVDRSEGHLQVLGTPTQTVYFTSYHNETLGGDTFPLPTTAAPGDWGGLVFRNELDIDARASGASRRVLEEEGIFINYVNHAQLSFGGGDVLVSGLQDSFAPITLNEARPNISFNTITNSAGAAIGADPNSFKDNLVNDVLDDRVDENGNPAFRRYTADYNRIGPEIYFNTLINNTINGLFVSIDTSAGQILDRLEVAARFNDTDITHVLSEHLVIQGTPGGARQPAYIQGTIGISNGVVNLSGGVLPNWVIDGSLLSVGFTQGTITITNGVALLTGGVWPTWAQGAQLTVGQTTYTVAARNSNSQVTLTNPTANVPSPTAFTLQNTFEVQSRDSNTRLTLKNALGLNVTPGQSFLLRGRVAQQDARLRIDPGIVVKADSARIETEIGAQLIAEGLPNNRVVFTSLVDDRFGGSGTFDTAGRDLGPFTQGSVSITNGVVTLVGAIWPVWAAGAELIVNGVTYTVATRDSDTQLTLTDLTVNVAGGTFVLQKMSRPVAGDWGGLYFGPVSLGSVDHALITYAGGITPVEGGFSSFNAVEIQQADVRLTNSVLEKNADGSEAPRNNVRFNNDEGTIYVRGAQPVIVNNIIRDGGGAAISINANALNSDLVHDWGRNTGELSRTGDFLGNQGALIRNNRIGRNEINGMVVRGGELTTQTVWDDSDIVHVVTEEILVPNHHTFSGVRLQSSPTQSLVVKLSGQNAGFTAGGSPLDIDDRIGGSVQVLGTPGHAVVMTSLFDNTVGAGLDPEGRPQTDTSNVGSSTGGSTLPTGPESNTGTLIDNDVPVSVPGHFEIQLDTGGDNPLANGAGFTAQGLTQLFLNEDFIFEYLNYLDVGGDGDAIRLGATTITQAATLIAPDLVESRGNFQGQNGTVNWRVVSKIDNGGTVLESTITFDSTTPLGAVRLINYLDEDVGTDIGDITDDILNTRGTPGAPDFQLFTIDSDQRVGFAQSGVYAAGPGLVNATWDGWAADQFADLQNDIETANPVFSVPGTIDLVDLPQGNDPELGTIYGPNDVTSALSWSVDPAATTATITVRLGFISAPPTPVGAGDWRSVKLDQYGNDRNAAVITEREQNVGGNDSPQNAQSLGELAPNERSGDENRRLAFDVHGAIATKADADVYSFTARAGTEIWLDIDRSLPALDSVIELIGADGSVLARSDDSVLGDQISLQAGLRVYPLQRDIFQGHDLYTTNRHDAGMRLILPGPTDTQQTYYIRIRSANDANGQPASRGGYQLQLRLRELDEIPGSTVQFADIRYARNGIEVLGTPQHSPLLGESGETTADNETRANSQELGNVLSQDRGAISVSGSLTDYNDVDWYQFTLDWDKIDDYPDGTGIRHDDFASLIFDIDFADGAGRPDTTLALFDETGTLIYVARNSGVEDDQRAPDLSSDLGEIQRGSFGPNDPFLGPVMLRENNGQVYYLAVTSDALQPDAWKNNPLARIEPHPAQDRIVDDRVGSSFFPIYTNEVRQPPDMLFGDRPLNTYADTWQLGDVTMFVNDGERLYTIDPYTGGWDTDIGRAVIFNGPYGDLAMRTDGRLNGMALNGQEGQRGSLVEISTETAAGTVIGDDGIQGGPIYMAFTIIDAGNDRRISYAASTDDRLFAFDADSGSTDDQLTGTDNTDTDPDPPGADILGLDPADTVTGLAFVAGDLYGVTDTGKLLLFDLSGFLDPNDPATATVTVIATLTAPDPLNPTIMVPVPFSGLSKGPTNVETTLLGTAGPYAEMLFATDSLGGLHSFDTAGIFQNILAGGRHSVETGLPGLLGVAFSSLDYNLWHTSGRQDTADGRGIYPTPDGNRGDVHVLGGTGYYFGLEEDAGQPGARLYSTNNGVYNTYNLPGGAHGTLTSDPFSLVGYDFADAPTLYFNYFSQHDSDATDNPNNSALDSFRVYASNNGGEWFGLAQSPVPQRLAPNTFDGSEGLSNDTGGWRQALVDLSNLAGLDNVRLRFDFNTSGGRDIGLTHFGGEVLAAKPGAELFDGQFIIINHVDAGLTTFEFDMGFSLVVPIAGAGLIADGETFTIDDGTGPQTLEFDKAGDGVVSGNTAVVIAPNSTAQQIAQAIVAAITGLGNAAIVPHLADGTSSHLGDVAISLEGVTSIAQAAPAGAPGLGLRGDAPGTVTQLGAIPIPIHADMTAEEVAIAIAETMDSHFIVTVAAGIDIPDVFQTAKVDRDSIYIMQASTLFNAGTGGFLQIFEPGPLVYSSLLPGDPFLIAQRARANAGRNNNFEGVILDDFIIGLAERGEVMTNVTGGADVVPTVPRRPVGQVLEGAYQLEIRRGPDYGFPLYDVDDDGTILYGLEYTRGWDSNDRFSDGTIVTMPSPSAIAPGTTFTVSDGINTVVFEFDLSGDGVVGPGHVPVNIFDAQTALDVARAAGQAINANQLLNSVAGWDAGLNVNDEQFGSPNLTLSRVARFDSTLFPVTIDNVVNDRVDITLLDPSNIPEGTYVAINDGQRRIQFEFDRDFFSNIPSRSPLFVLPQSILVDISAATTAVEVAAALVEAIKAADIETVTRALFPNGVLPGTILFPTPGVTRATADHEAGTARVSLGNIVDFSVVVPPVIPPFPATPPAVIPPGGPAISIYNGKAGDRNPVRDQGQVVIHSNSISNSAEFGIRYDAGPRDAGGSLPHPGAVRNLNEFNTARLVRGVAIANNTIHNNTIGGILVSGDPGTDPLAPVPVGRIYNNTIYGGELASGVGIRVTESASPTLLNNVLSGLQTGIEVDASSASTVVGGTVFHGNTTNTAGTGLGTFPILVPSSEEIFVDPVNGNFYPIVGSRVIDSSVDTLQERTELANVMTAIGYSTSPLLAPERDQLGQLRVNDPSVPSPPGQGNNVFKDRGAVERADFAGPTARMFDPEDNDPRGRDLNNAANRVRLGAQIVTNFAVQLVDGVLPTDPALGVGVDDSTVTGNQFTLTRNGVTLVQDIDYVFSYDSLNNVARFIPTEGIWTPGSYFIRLNNSPIVNPLLDPPSGIRDLAGNVLQPNELTGLTQFGIEIVQVDFGDAPDDTTESFPTLFVDDNSQPGAYHVVVPGFQLGSSVTSETDGQPSPNADTDNGDDGVTFQKGFVPGEATPVRVNVVRTGLPAQTTAYLNAWVDFNSDGDWNDAGERVFTNQVVVAGNNDLVINVPAGATHGASYARFRLSTQQNLSPSGAADNGEVEDYRVEVSPLIKYELQLNYANSNKELFRDAFGRYFVAPDLQFTAEVYVDDQRTVNAAGVRQAFADLVYDNDLIDWNAGTLSFGPSYSSGQTGAIDEPNQLVDEAGGIAPVQTGGTRQLLFRVNGTVKSAALRDQTFILSLNQADASPAHDTLLFNNPQPVVASYDSETIVVQPNPWQNAFHRMDVNHDGKITGLDALIIINRLNTQGSGALPVPPVAPNTPAPFYDVTGDNNITPLDALVIINLLNNGGGGVITGAASGGESSPVAFAAASSETAAAPAAASFVTNEGIPLASSFDVTGVAISVAGSGSTAAAPAIERAIEMASVETAASAAVIDDVIGELFPADDDTGDRVRVAQSAPMVADLAESLWDDDYFTASSPATSLDTLAVAARKSDDLDDLLVALGFESN